MGSPSLTHTGSEREVFLNSSQHAARDVND